MGDVAEKVEEYQDPLAALSKSVSVIMDQLKELHLSIDAVEALRHPSSVKVEQLSVDVQDEIALWSKIVAAFLLYHALAAIQIDDAVAVKVGGAAAADELIANKRTAWEWFFSPWQGHEPRTSLELVCAALHLEPSWVRGVVRRSKLAKPPTLPMPPGERYELFYDLDDKRAEDNARDMQRAAIRHQLKVEKEAAEAAAKAAAVSATVAAVEPPAVTAVPVPYPPHDPPPVPFAPALDAISEASADLLG